MRWENTSQVNKLIEILMSFQSGEKSGGGSFKCHNDNLTSRNNENFSHAAVLESKSSRVSTLKNLQFLRNRFETHKSPSDDERVSFNSQAASSPKSGRIKDTKIPRVLQ